MSRSACHRALPFAGGLVALALLAGPAAAQSPPPPCPAVKGRLVAVDPRARTVTMDRPSRRDVLPATEAGLLALRDVKPGDQVTLQLDCLVPQPYPVIRVLAVARANRDVMPPPVTQPPGPRSTTVLLSTEAACVLAVDFKPWGPLVAGARTELKLSPGEHMLEATTADGRSWKEKVKVGSEQLIVEVKLGQPVATLAQYDAQAARVYGSLEALKTAGQALDEILRKKNFKFEKADAAAVSTAAATWTRELAVLESLIAPAERKQVTGDLASLDADVREYAGLLEKALETAQKNFTIMGEATTLRGRAQARAELLKLPAETAALLQASPPRR